MRQRWYQLLVFVLLASVLFAPAALAANGKISGVVKSADGTPAVGANVVLEGTTLGASADVNGRYFILNIPPGTYRARASGVGFTAQVVTGLLVEQDQVVTLDFTLQSEAVGLAEIVIQAERPIVDKSLTASKSTLTSDNINSLPINSQIGVLATSASAYKGFVRGGKITETKTLVDGVDVSDSYYAYIGDENHTPYRTYNNVPRYMGSEVSKIGGNMSFTAVEQVSVNTGAVGAEYSSASAGVISYSLREGRGALTGSVTARVSQPQGLKAAGPDPYADDYRYFQEKSDLQRRVDSLRQRRNSGLPAPTLPTDSIRLGWYTYQNGKYIKETPQMDFQASIGGDITKDWGFYATGRFFDSHGTLPGEFSREVNITLKTQYNFTGDIKLTGMGILTDRGNLFGWKNRGYSDQARFFLEGVPKYDGTDAVGMLKLTHVLTPASFYEVQASYTSNLSTTGYSDDNGDGYCAYDEDGDFIKLSTLAMANKYISNDVTKGTFFRNQDEPLSTTSGAFVVGNALARLARPAFFYEDLLLTTFTGKADYTNQVDEHHRLQAGIQARFQSVDMFRQASFLGAVDAKQQYYTEDWNPKPTEYGGYIQDRMEYAGLIINLGLRVDAWNPNADEFTNYFAPYLDVRQPVDTLPGVTTLVTTRQTQRSKDVGTEVYWSPRLGVSHPVSDVAAMYFSYSRNMTPPPYSRMYASYNNFGNTSLPNNPSVKQQPFISNNYELGVQWEFVPNFGLNFNAYWRAAENYGYTSYNVVPRSGPYGTTYFIGFSAGYADARGVELTLEARRQNVLEDFMKLTARGTYAFSYVKASGLVSPLPSNQQTSFSTAGGDSARLKGDLPLDDIRFYNRVESNVIGGLSTLTSGYDRMHRISYQLILEFPLDFILSSIGTFQSGFYYMLTLPQSVTDARVLGRESAQGPWNKNVDVRLEKGFTLGDIRFALYVESLNVFNWTNIIGYDNTTSGTVQWETQGYPAGALNRPAGTDGTTFYANPRQFYFGARVNF